MNSTGSEKVMLEADHVSSTTLSRMHIFSREVVNNSGRKQHCEPVAGVCAQSRDCASKVLLEVGRQVGRKLGPNSTTCRKCPRTRTGRLKAIPKAAERADMVDMAGAVEVCFSPYSRDLWVVHRYCTPTLYAKGVFVARSTTDRISTSGI